jgi:hypothetical protein
VFGVLLLLPEPLDDPLRSAAPPDEPPLPLVDPPLLPLRLPPDDPLDPLDPPDDPPGLPDLGELLELLLAPLMPLSLRRMSSPCDDLFLSAMTYLHSTLLRMQ